MDDVDTHIWRDRRPSHFDLKQPDTVFGSGHRNPWKQSYNLDVQRVARKPRKTQSARLLNYFVHAQQ
jgi:hypothetical protein